MVHANPASAKLALRAQMRALRGTLALAAPQAGEAAAALLPIERLPAAAVIGGYLRQGSEINPAAVLARFEAAGARIALPAVTAPDAALVFRAWTPEAECMADAAGVRAPPLHAETLRPTLLIVPLLAFDRDGGRLGQGGGHFDRTLAALDGEGPVFALGLAYAGQEVARAPLEAHDRRLDAVLTDKEFIAIRNPADMSPAR